MELKEKICNEYLNFKSIATLAKEYHLGALKIKQILNENNIEIRSANSPRIKRMFIVADYHTKKYEEKDGFHYVAIAKKDGTRFLDHENKGGFLTKYIKENFGISSTLYERRIYYQTTGNYWWEQWFDIVSEKNKEVKKCPYCEWETEDIDNRSGAFTKHLWEKHNLTIDEYLKEHTEDKEYFVYVNSTIQLQKETDKTKFVTCAICGKKLKHIGGKHLQKHNITLDEYILKYCTDYISDDYRKILSEKMEKLNLTLESSKRSKAEYEIEEFIKKFGYNVECNKNINGVSIDLYIPELQFAIEYNGIYYHKESLKAKGKNMTSKMNFHLNKTEKCKELGIKLIQIFEDEYLEHKDIVLNKIAHVLKCNNTLKRIMGRRCEIREISNSDAEEFLKKNHIQGFSRSTIYLGAFYENALIAVMTFKREYKHENRWELTRFASDNDYRCQGVGGKLFKYFIRNYNPIFIKSFADRRWTVDEENNIYLKLGFVFDSYLKPDYKYVGVVRNKRTHKFNLRKDRLMKLDKNGVLNMDMTEKVMATLLGYDRIWDCGLIKYVWEK